MMDIRQTVLEGILPDGLRIFDAHAHVGEGEYSSAYVCTLPVEEMLRLSRKIGIGAMAASSFKALGGDVIAGNERLMELSAMFPGELYAYLFYDPGCGGAVMEQLKKYRRHKRFIGVKIHPRESKATLESEAYDSLYEFCAVHDIMILCHTWETEPENNPASFAKVLSRYPRLKLLLGHMGGTYRGCLDSIALAKQYENVYLDINGSLYSQIWIEELAKMAPVEKLIFSTDQAFNDPRIIVGRVLLSELDDNIKKKILCGNFEAAVGRTLIQ
jgi:predicted TIM-barrel fold metal-dependent hydrolase